MRTVIFRKFETRAGREWTRFAITKMSLFQNIFSIFGLSENNVIRIDKSLDPKEIIDLIELFEKESI